jgi:hypothetical protein
MKHDFNVEDLMSARDVLDAFWRALAQADEQALTDLYDPISRERDGFGTGPLAAHLRERWEVTPEQCASIEISNRARVVESELVAFFCQPALRAELETQATPVRGWTLALIPGGSSGWQVWGTLAEDDLARAEDVFLPVVPDTDHVV